MDGKGSAPAHIRLHGDGVAGDAGESEAADTGKHDGIFLAGSFAVTLIALVIL